MVTVSASSGVVQMNEVKYINNDPQYGVRYDFRKLRKAYKKLGCPPDVYDPCTAPLEEAKYFVLLSERNIGKTTNWLLFGMLMNKFYSSTIQYVRQTDDEIMPKALRDLFKTILEHDYIEKITEGQYNSVVYKSRRYYYSLVDDSGQVVDVAPEHFMFCCSVEKAQDLKSSYNAPRGDIIIFDEFVRKFFYKNEFISFCDLTKTIIRGRRSPFIIMAANNIDPYSPYYNELEIFDDVQALKIGDNKLIQTSMGTKIYLEKIGAALEKKRKNTIINQLFYGFRNPQLSAITGEGDWSIKNYQHIPEPEEGEEEPYVITRRLYILYSTKLVRFDVVQHQRLGLCLYAHWATKTYKDSIIMTVEPRYDSRYVKGLGSGKLLKLMKKATEQNRIYYATNDIGAFVENYVKNVIRTV